MKIELLKGVRLQNKDHEIIDHTNRLFFTHKLRFKLLYNTIYFALRLMCQKDISNRHAIQFVLRGKPNRDC